MRVGMDHNTGVGEGGCDLVEEYLEQDLANHSKNNRPYKVLKDEVVGRHMVASRTIKAGEIIMEDIPLTYGPVCSSGVNPVCLGCYRLVTGDVTCDLCGWPVCSQLCAQRDQHRNLECKLFTDHGIKVDSSTFNYNAEEKEPAYSCISPLRALILRDNDKDKWNRIWGLMSHNSQRRKESYWTERHQPIVDYITKTLGLTKFSEEDIDTVLGIFLVNDFEINAKVGEDEWSSNEKNSIRGLYQIASIPNHDCISNTVHTFSSLEDGFRMVIKAGRDIKKGEEITHSYVDAMEPVLIRQELLTLGKFFHCLCGRCSDPTELGTYCSSLKCPSCKAPIISTDPKDLKADWSCTKCKKIFNHLKISNLTAAIKTKSESLEQNQDIPAHEAFIKKFTPILHDKHIFLINAKYMLAKMYGRMAGYEADKLTEQLLNRKLFLCEEVLSVLDKIMPGNSRMRGVMLYELHLPYVMLANRQLQKGPGSGADPKKIKENLKKGLGCLTKGMAILKLQPDGSFESKIYQGSKQSLLDLQNWEKQISEML